MKTVEIVQLIKITLKTKGSGECEIDPVRKIVQYYDMNGTLLIEFDPFENKVTYFNPDPL